MREQYRRFAEEYAVDLNATQAAIRAGYSEKTAGKQAHQLLKILDIQEEVQRQMELRSARTHITQDKVLRELARIGFANVGQILDDAKGGLLDQLTADDLAAISSVKTRSYKSGDEDMVEREIRFHDKTKALEMLAKHLGMFTEKVDVSMEIPVRIVNNVPRVLPDDDE